MHEEALGDAVADRRAWIEGGVGVLKDDLHSPSQPLECSRAGRVHVLVSTIVVEVGVDVPNATVLMVEGAERYGLATLHQLRGRIGRGGHAATAVFFFNRPAESASPAQVENWKSRMKAIKRLKDGFKIAEMDFDLRGTGELFGTDQHGRAELKVANLKHDGELLKQAREDVRAVLKADPALERPEHALLRERLRRVFGDRLELVEIG